MPYKNKRFEKNDRVRLPPYQMRAMFSNWERHEAQRDLLEVSPQIFSKGKTSPCRGGDTPRITNVDTAVFLQQLAKVYVVGATNSGKSSFINSMIFKSNKYKEPNKVHYRSKYATLTESAAPGTTLDFISVEEVRLGFKILDTPGVPNMNQVQSLITDYQDLMSVLPNKQMSSLPLNIKNSYSVWLGALGRVDFLSGEDKFFTFVMPPHVTIHRTPLEKAESVYAKHAGTLLRPTYNSEPQKVKFVAHELALNCDDFKLALYFANFDISIEGLGWFSLQGKGFANLLLHLPEGVRYHIRKDPMFPYEVEEKGLKRMSGNPVNSNTRKNQMLAQKFQYKKKLQAGEEA